MGLDQHSYDDYDLQVEQQEDLEWEKQLLSYIEKRFDKLDLRRRADGDRIVEWKEIKEAVIIGVRSNKEELQEFYEVVVQGLVDGNLLLTEFLNRPHCKCLKINVVV